mmetsp:Transcript_41428/g.65650  ORF Transcript_41428/g.65650 Transcript_41428/m.65650 type:complete len:223 (+) Transcript_41428:67-735(+)
MGNLTPGTVCCVKDESGGVTCCAKAGEGKGAEIVRSRPFGFPGLDTGDKLAEQHQEPTQSYQGHVPEPSSDHHEGDEEETYDDGSTYLGQLISGKRHGHGVWTSPAEQYSGQWKHDHRDGQGRQTWQDGRVYEGQFQEGKFDGRGRMEWHTPQGLMVYEGEYVNDVKHGQGKYIWPDGRIYDGEWSQGKRWGKATYVNSGGERREGIWKDDKLERWCDQEEG